MLMFLKSLNDMKKWGSKTLLHNLGVSILATPTSPLWESGTLAEDKGVLWYPVLGGHRVGHFRGALVNKTWHEIEKSYIKRIKWAPHAHILSTRALNTVAKRDGKPKVPKRYFWFIAIFDENPITKRYQDFNTLKNEQVQRTQNEYADIYKVTNSMTPNRTKRSPRHIKRRSQNATPWMIILYEIVSFICEVSFFW